MSASWGGQWKNWKEEKKGYKLCIYVRNNKLKKINLKTHKKLLLKSHSKHYFNGGALESVTLRF